MKEMIKRVREERGGFTLAELLIVVAIIMILVAIAVPIFMGANDSAKASVAAANERALKAQATADFLLADEDKQKDFSKNYYITDNGDIRTTADAGGTQYTAKVEQKGDDFIVTITGPDGETTEG